jgi:hypothetical protein
VKWSQRKGTLSLIIDVPDVKNEVIVLEDERLVFKGEGGIGKRQEYNMELQFFAPIDKNVKCTLKISTPKIASKH